MDIEKIKSCIVVARDNYKFAKELFEKTTAYHWAVVILYHSLLMYLKCWCECQQEIGNSIGYPKDHYFERDIIKKNLKSASSYKTILDAARTFRYDPQIIINIQNKNNKSIIKSYFKKYNKCVAEIISEIKACNIVN